jgi:hypothetical protein
VLKTLTLKKQSGSPRNRQGREEYQAIVFFACLYTRVLCVFAVPRFFYQRN